MPARKIPNPVVGTYHCDDCGQEASVLMITAPKRKGSLYTRCGCGCDQRNAKHIQDKHRARMVARPGFEWVKEGKPDPNPAPAKPASADFDPNDLAPATQPQPEKKAAIPNPEPKQEPKAEPNRVDDPKNKLKGAISGVFG